MNNKRKTNRNLPFIIGLALLSFIIGGCASGTTSTGSKTNANTSGKSAAEIYSKAAPGANPPNALGAPNAPVTIEEFADFQCPTCALMHPKVQELRAAYGDRVRIIFRDFPLQMHPHGYEAAVAAEAAGMQGKFWDMQNLLFTNQNNWATAPDARKIFEDYAQKLGLDVEKFKDDMAGLITKNRVDADLQRGNSLGINSTPTFFINGNPVGQQDLSVEGMKRIIDGELQKAQSRSQPNQSAPTANNSAQSNINAENK
ncbi:MAG: DsbA family protein [Pyrinomonadaceae bacterium]